MAALGRVFRGFIEGKYFGVPNGNFKWGHAGFHVSNRAKCLGFIGRSVLYYSPTRVGVVKFWDGSPQNCAPRLKYTAKKEPLGSRHETRDTHQTYHPPRSTKNEVRDVC